MWHPAVLRGGGHAEVLLRTAIVRRGCKQSGKLARVKQREWRKAIPPFNAVQAVVVEVLRAAVVDVVGGALHVAIVRRAGTRKNQSKNGTLAQTTRDAAPTNASAH
jgi:hypothetical protein